MATKVTKEMSLHQTSTKCNDIWTDHSWALAGPTNWEACRPKRPTQKTTTLKSCWAPALPWSKKTEIDAD